MILYGLLVLLWANLHHDRVSAAKAFTGAFWTLVALLVLAFGALAWYTFRSPEPRLLWQGLELGFAVVYTLALGVAMFYGCMVVHKLRPEPRLASGRGNVALDFGAASQEMQEVAAQRAVMKRVRALGVG